MRTSRLIAAVGAVAVPARRAGLGEFESVAAIPGTPVSDTFSFTNQAIEVQGGGIFGDAIALAPFANTYDVTSITVDTATLSSINAATWASEARIDLFSGGGTGFGGFSTFADQTYVSPLVLGAPLVLDVTGVGLNTGDGISLDFWETYDDGSDTLDDQVWDRITITFAGEIGGTPAVIEDESFAAGNLGVGDSYNNNNSHVAGGKDLYTFTLTEDGVVRIETTDPGSGIDTEIGLYDAGGNLIASNDDSAEGGLISLLTETLSAGDYTVVAGTFNTDFATDPTLAGVTSGTDDGDYGFDISVTAIPEPGSLALLGLGGLALLRRRR